MTLPDRPDLTGRTLVLAITLWVEYPRDLGGQRYRYEETTLTAERFVTVGTPAQAAANLWGGMVGGLSGVSLFVAAIVWLFWCNRQFGKASRPPEVLVDEVRE